MNILMCVFLFMINSLWYYILILAGDILAFLELSSLIWLQILYNHIGAFAAGVCIENCLMQGIQTCVRVN